MTIASRVLTACVAALHLYIAWFEMFAWTSVGPDVFSSFDPALFPDTVELAANQGVYNAFLAAGLIWSLFITEATWRFRIALCFLSFVFIAGIAAAITVEFSSGIPQMATAGAALVALFLAEARGTAELND